MSVGGSLNKGLKCNIQIELHGEAGETVKFKKNSKVFCNIWFSYHYMFLNVIVCCSFSHRICDVVVSQYLWNI